MRNENTIKASIIVVSYNRKEILKYCLRRLLNQTTREYEVIVVDDGSTDGTSELISNIKYQNSNIKSIRFHKRMGQPYARNQGVKEAKGEIVIFVDSDVIVAPNFVEDHIKLHTTDNLVVQGLVRHIRKPQDVGKFSLLIDGLCLTGLITQNVSIRKEWLLKAGGFDESFGKTMGYMDVDIGIRLKKLGIRTKYSFRRCKAWHVDAPPTIDKLKEKFEKNYERAKNAMLIAKKYGEWAKDRYLKPKKVLFISKFFNTQKWAENEEKIKFLTHLYDFPLPLFPMLKEIMKYHYCAKGIIEAHSNIPMNRDIKYSSPLPTESTYRVSRSFSLESQKLSELPLIHFLFLSNGYGEDRSAAIIANELKRLKLDIKVMGAPLLSRGEEYEKRDIEVAIKGRMPPSGGFLRELRGLKDIMSFYIPIKYYLLLRKMRNRVGYGVVVGDIFLLILGWLGLRRKLVFFANTKSDYQLPHFKLEKWIMRRLTLQVFTHDELTAKKLSKDGIKTVFLGNPMADGLYPEKNLKTKGRLVGILPGSRNEAYKNFLKILEVVEQLSKIRQDLKFATALHSAISVDKLVNFAKQKGWSYAPCHSELVSESHDRKSLTKEEAEIFLLYNAFVDIITQSDVIIGLAGTANEQAAALGKPIVSFTGCGPQTSATRLKNQEKLLGGCLKFVKEFPDDVINEILKLLDNEDLRKEKGEIGVQRMGPPGGALRIAKFLIEGRM